MQEKGQPGIEAYHINLPLNQGHQPGKIPQQDQLLLAEICLIDPAEHLMISATKDPREQIPLWRHATDRIQPQYLKCHHR